MQGNGERGPIPNWGSPVIKRTALAYGLAQIGEIANKDRPFCPIFIFECFADQPSHRITMAGIAFPKFGGSL
ncbi:hypothetical protein NTCA1_53630 [Novosphingobium sp. TCA1]|nr:hypothetical protein NTCA1_53630 [Novosphingobium sp. TCA1]